MTKKKAEAPKTRAKSAGGGKFGPNFSEEQKALAMKVWLAEGAPSYDKLVEILSAKHGIKVNKSTICRWVAADLEWRKLYLDHNNPMDPLEIIQALEQAEDESSLLKPEHLSGVKTALIARLYTSIRAMKFNNVAEAEAGIACTERLEALIHAERGKSVSPDKKGASVTLLPPPRDVSVPLFNGGKRGANGGGH